MYEYISGRLIEKSPTRVIIDINGVGYLIQISVTTHADLPVLGELVKLLTYFIVREDAQILYGFSTEEERELFKLLISVNGIGPKMAMSILSGLSLSELKRAIVEGLLPVLTGISGVGKKTAERIIIELRERVVLDRRESASASIERETEDGITGDAIRALIQLGYKKQNAKEAIQRVLKNSSEKVTIEELVRASLKYV